MFDRIGVARIVSKIDFRSGFHPIKKEPERCWKPAFYTKYDRFEYFVMPMRACSAAATFQSLINSVFSRRLLGSKDEFERISIGDLVFYRLKKNVIVSI